MYECKECENHCVINIKLDVCLEVESGKIAQWHEVIDD